MTEQSTKETFRITDLNTDTEFYCADDTSLLVGMERAGSRSISIGCRGGGCGVCKIDVVSGTFSGKRMSKAHISEEDIAAGTVLACRIIPLSDMSIRSKTILKPANTGSK